MTTKIDIYDNTDTTHVCLVKGNNLFIVGYQDQSSYIPKEGKHKFHLTDTLVDPICEYNKGDAHSTAKTNKPHLTH